jgi:hypothetical protein
MVKAKSFNGLPPNFDELPVELQRLLEEQAYRRQLACKWGYVPGDPRLTSMDAEGLPLSGQFGARVKEKAAEEDVEHAD